MGWNCRPINVYGTQRMNSTEKSQQRQGICQAACRWPRHWGQILAPPPLLRPARKVPRVRLSGCHRSEARAEHRGQGGRVRGQGGHGEGDSWVGWVLHSSPGRCVYKCSLYNPREGLETHSGTEGSFGINPPFQSALHCTCRCHRAIPPALLVSELTVLEACSWAVPALPPKLMTSCRAHRSGSRQDASHFSDESQRGEGSELWLPLGVQSGFCSPGLPLAAPASALLSCPCGRWSGRHQHRAQDN